MTSEEEYLVGDRPPTKSYDPQARTRALQSLLIEKGVVSTDAIDEYISIYAEEIGPVRGKRVVARAWTDPAFREWLLEDATAAVDEAFGYTMRTGRDLVAVANAPDVHNVTVCTMCSCYPWPILGLPPTYYKSPAYRSRMVKEPRVLLAEFGVELEDDVDVRVFDATGEVRYFVVPQRPPDTEGLDEAALAELVTRDSMVGVERLGGERA